MAANRHCTPSLLHIQYSASFLCFSVFIAFCTPSWLLLSATTPAKYEEEAGRYWDLFYKRNSDKFFKDRHYFEKEWPQLTQGALTVLEVC